MLSDKLECPHHGIRAVRVQQYRTGTWFKCRRCKFKRWIENQSFTVMASMVLVACYVKSWIIILGH